MQPHCWVPKYTSSKRKKSCRGQSFHLFPKDPALRCEWIHKIKRDPDRRFKIHMDTKECSYHFTEESFLKTLNRKWKLKNCAVSTLFAWTDSTVRPVRRTIVRGTTSHATTTTRQCPAGWCKFQWVEWRYGPSTPWQWLYWTAPTTGQATWGSPQHHQWSSIAASRWASSTFKISGR